ncbi:hypothetical protein IB643_03140, partial [Allofrancisella guangzhouensis]
MKPSNEKYTDFRKIFETSLAYFLIKEKSKNQELANFISSIFNSMLNYLNNLFEKVKNINLENHIIVFLDSKRIHNLVSLIKSERIFISTKKYHDYLDTYESSLRLNYTNIYTTEKDSRIIEYYSIIYELYSKEENMIIIKAAASIMLVQAINWILSVATEYPFANKYEHMTHITLSALYKARLYSESFKIVEREFQ